eukprot:9074964-Alexandrium_andersonii.AAC.1
MGTGSIATSVTLVPGGNRGVPHAGRPNGAHASEKGTKAGQAQAAKNCPLSPAPILRRSWRTRGAGQVAGRFQAA